MTLLVAPTYFSLAPNPGTFFNLVLHGGRIIFISDLQLQSSESTLTKPTASAYEMYALLLALAFTISSLTYFVLNPKSRKVVLDRLRFPRQKTNGSLTPPRTISPGKDAKSQPGNDELFPPHRLEALADLPPGALKGPGKSAKELIQLPPDYSRLTPDKAVCNTDEFLDHVTATGFTVREIRRLGDFPDYSTLSGIPLPNEYKGFDIKTAMPRPYRPFRWPYHQTMCTYTHFLHIGIAS